ncbi:MAG TPA: GNAT family N-acetyltransferase [Dehalococcoidia bacterium]|nr:GNAT family N-acetyltransferase [Dehalococcoidia bacterium]
MARVHVASWQTAYRGMIQELVLKDFTIDKWEDHFQKAITEKTEEIVVTEEHGNVLGYTIIGPSRDEDIGKENCGEVWGLYISPDHWRKGLGSRLTEWAFSELRSRGYDIVTLWVFQRNVAAVKFYEAMGFVLDGTTKHIRADAPLAVRYRKRLSTR